MSTLTGHAPGIDWAAAARPLPGQRNSGDAFAVVNEDDATTLVAVIDGLGHGNEAAKAAAAAVATVRDCAGQPLQVVFAACHRALASTRGAVASLARIDASTHTMCWAAVGDVDATVVRGPRSTSDRPRVTIVPRGGVVGFELPPIYESTVSLEPQDLLVMTTDGIDAVYRHNLVTTGGPTVIADAILQAHALERDDALVLVARYHPGRP
jgi:serine phosphatase RsbU (regulator of sigma subunit)